MAEIYYLQEYRIRKDIKEVEDALNVARKMVSKGLPVPDETFKRLETMRLFLEQKLIDFIEKEQL